MASSTSARARYGARASGSTPETTRISTAEDPSSGTAAMPPRVNLAARRRASEAGAAMLTRRSRVSDIGGLQSRSHSSFARPGDLAPVALRCTGVRLRASRGDEELAVSCRSQDRRFSRSEHRQAPPAQILLDLRDDARVHGGVAHHSALAHLGTPRLEL